MPKPVGEPGGGMANAIVGSLMVIGHRRAVRRSRSASSAASTRPSTPARGSPSAVRFAADTLNGVPSIVIGVFVYGIAVLPFRHFSALAGGLALGHHDDPAHHAHDRGAAAARAGDAAGRGAGARRHARRARCSPSSLPAALPGIITGILLALARIAGETAPLLFTALNNRFWSHRRRRSRSRR